MRKFTIAAILIGLTFMACKKDEPEPTPEEEETEVEDTPCTTEYIFSDSDLGTLEPGDYLAAYPGSWWTFSNGDELTCENAEYSIANITEEDYVNCKTYVDRAHAVVAKINGNYTLNSDGAYIWGDSILVEDRLNQTGIYQQIGFEPGSFWPEAGAESEMSMVDGGVWDYYTPIRKFEAHHDSLETPGGDKFYDVVQIIQFHNFSNSNGDHWNTGIYHLYYAKEIGLIWEDDFYSEIRDRYLVDYYIAPH